MKRVIIWISLLCLLVFIIAAASFFYERFSDKLSGGGLENLEQEKEPEIKNTAPDFKVLNSDGEEVNLSDYFGRPIVINFWTTWC